MFDDYAYKNTSQRISLSFVQKRDEPMYPWEIAAFLNRLNTVYYKYELLNSICSALNHGISPSDIFIFDKSLPLYRRYSAMNLLEESSASRHFYSIGSPFPLLPNEAIYGFNLMYKVFRTVNSFLYKNHVQPLRTDSIASAYEVLQEDGLDAAESYIVDLALERAKRSIEGAKKKKKPKNEISEVDIWQSLEKYQSKKQELLKDLGYVDSLNDERREEVILENTKQSRRAASLLLAFFRYFDKTTRPLVCARVADGKFRVLGRSLINKREQTGLELREATRNSPLKVLIEGGIAAVQAVRRDTREEELHQLEIQKKKIELQQASEKLYRERLLSDRERLINNALEKQLDQFTQGTDLRAVDQLQASFIKHQIEKAYKGERRSAGTLMSMQDIVLDADSIKLIDTKA